MGIASAPGRRSSIGAELGCTGAGSVAVACATSRRTRSVVGCAAAGCASSSSACGTGAARATGRTASRGAVMECRTSGSSGAGVGSAGRVASITHTDRAIVEPSGSSLERTGAAGLGTGCTLIHRLGCAAPRARGATTDRRTRLERTCRGGVGRTEDRRARGTGRALVVGAGPTARRAGGRRTAVELARALGSSGTCPMVTPDSGTGRG
jgi:hypothetical protein